jgi:hypothetical protein
MRVLLGLLLTLATAAAQFEYVDPCEENVPPVASARVVNALPVPSDLFSGNPWPSFVVLALNGRDSRIEVDASSTYDSNSNLLSSYLVRLHVGQYRDDSLYCGLSPKFFYHMRVSDHTDSLTVYDSCGETDTIPFGVHVIPPLTAIWWLRDDLDEMRELYWMPIPQLKHLPTLYRTLDKATGDLGAGKKQRTIRHLRHFQRLIRSQRQNLGPALTNAYFKYTDMVIAGINYREPETGRSAYSVDLPY